MHHDSEAAWVPTWAKQQTTSDEAGSCFLRLCHAACGTPATNQWQTYAQGRKRQCVFGAQLVRARRFYGYADGESMFIKVTVYNPRDVSKVADLLRVRFC